MTHLQPSPERPAYRSIHVRAEAGNPETEAVSAILLDRLAERCKLESTAEGAILTLELSIAEGPGTEGFRIERPESGTVRIVGNDARGLLYGVGHVLHHADYVSDGIVPDDWTGESVPQGKVRGMYLASHFFNWYHVAPRADVVRYLEDLALWGVNSIVLVFPIINLNGWDDPETDKSFSQIRSMFLAAKQLGLDVGILVCPNQDFKTPVEAFRAVPNPDPLGRRGNHGNNICPSAPGAREYILGNMREMLRRVSDIELDYFCSWPYDEGGCACERCRPWGARGFLELSKDIVDLARGFYPSIRVVLSTWMFDTPPEGEWEGLEQSLSRQNRWVDYILADSHEDFPRFPLERGVPGGVPLLNFPEISMWGLYPWGGYGATPLPNRFQKLWDQAKTVVSGGFPYSEGIYEDINKVVISQFYWESERTAEQTLHAYVGYEYSCRPDIRRDILSIIRMIEQNHVLAASGEKADAALAERAWNLARKADAELDRRTRLSWRWRLLYLRTLLDKERYGALSETDWPWPQQRNWGEVLEGNARAEEAMREIVGLFHAMPVDDGSSAQHRHVRPPLYS